MLAKNWKKIGMIILILAICVNIVVKLVNKYSLTKEMIYSATLLQDQVNTESETKNYLQPVTDFKNDLNDFVNSKKEDNQDNVKDNQNDENDKDDEKDDKIDEVEEESNDIIFEDESD